VIIEVIRSRHTRAFHRLLAAIAIFALTLASVPAARCVDAAPPATAKPTALLHVINGNNGFSTYGLLPSGSLSLLHPDKLPKARRHNNDPTWIAATPNGQFVYVVDFVTANIAELAGCGKRIVSDSMVM